MWTELEVNNRILKKERKNTEVHRIHSLEESPLRVRHHMFDMFLKCSECLQIQPNFQMISKRHFNKTLNTPVPRSH